MSYTNNNPFLLNIVPLFNVATRTGITTTTTDAQSSNTITVDTIEPYTSGNPVTIQGSLDVLGDLQVSGTITGSNIKTSTFPTGPTGSIFYSDGKGNATGSTGAYIDTSMNIYFSNNLHVSSNVYCQTLYQSSDKRFKQNIIPITGALSTLCELNGIHYTMNNKETLGFLAQEVLEVLPTSVHTDVSGFHSIDYSSIIPLLVEAVKELAKRV